MNDDVEMARLLTRRRALGLLGAAGAVLLAGGRTWDVLAEGEAASPLPACIVSPEQTEGPYFVDEKLNRSDIRSDPTSGAVKKGVPFQLTIRVYRINHNGCSPIKGAYVDLWHCDASGFYSDVRDPGFQTVGKKFLRGYQVTDDGGSVKFLTIYPGWYPGRTVHIHFKVRIRRSFLWDYDFTSQLYFDDAFTDAVYKRAPYASRKPRTVKNNGDGIFLDGGKRLILSPVESGRGYSATFDIGLRMA